MLRDLKYAIRALSITKAHLCDRNQASVLPSEAVLAVPQAVPVRQVR
jgi:hypothetical protein